MRIFARAHIAIFCLLISSQASAEPLGLSISATGAALISDRDRGDVFQLQADQRLNSAHLVSVGADARSRTFADGITLRDLTYGIGHVGVFAERLYVESQVTYSPRATFQPDWAASVTPHFVVAKGAEIGLLVKTARYKDESVWTLGPSWLQPFGDEWMAAVQVNVVSTDHLLVSEQGFIQWTPNTKSRVRLTGAAGRSVEGVDLEGEFASLAFGYRHSFHHKDSIFSFEPFAAQYRGSVRNEDTLGVRFEWKL